MVYWLRINTLELKVMSSNLSFVTYQLGDLRWYFNIIRQALVSEEHVNRIIELEDRKESNCVWNDGRE